MKKTITKFGLALLSIIFIGSNNLNAQTYNVNTIAGNGTGAYSGDGSSATAAELNYPTGVAVDNSGNIYIADYYNNRIRKVNTSGIITTIAGTGTAGYSGDGSAATAAKLNYPTDVVVDTSGNIYIADYNNQRIRKVNTSGIITTIAGNGTAGYAGDGSAATAAKLNYPFGLAVDVSGNVYIADLSNNVIRKVNTSSIISTIAGNNTAGYSGDGSAATMAELDKPAAVCVDGFGNIYIADATNNRIRKVMTSGIITTIAGNGTAGYSGDGSVATLAELNIPYGVSVDASGNVYVGDQANNRIRKINNSNIISTIAGNGTAAYSGDGGTATSAEFNKQEGIAIDAHGYIYIADTYNHRIRKLTPSPIAYFTANPTSVCAGSTVQFTDTSSGNPTTWQWTFTGGTPSSSTSQNPLITYSTAGNYDVKLKVSNSVGADSITKTNYIYVNPLPTVTVNSPTICSGTSTTLTAVGTTTYSWISYSWSTGSATDTTIVSPTTTTNYTVTVTDPGCSNSAVATVTVNPIPTITLTGNDSVSLGHQDTLTATGGGSYLWTTGSTNDTTIVSPTTATVYKVTVTNSFGCTAVDSFKVSIRIITTGIATLSENNSTNLYPNPATTNLSLSFTMQGKATNATINVFDDTGKSMMEKNTEISNGKTLPIDISQLSPGIYFVKITTAKTSQTIKFVKTDR